MATIFPGMDPYLEAPELWTGVHAALIVYIRDQLQPLLRPRYVAAIEERVFVEGPERDVTPDVWLRRNRPVPLPAQSVGADLAAPVVVEVPGEEVRQAYVAILDRPQGQRIVTLIEVLSPSNKYAGPGRELYRAKQREVLNGETHLVEIDLLRAGPHVLAVPEWTARQQGTYHYLACVNRAHPRPRWRYELYPCLLQRSLPRFGIPLADGDPDVPLDLQAVVTQTWEAGCYADRLNYDVPCRPPLSAEDQAWANECIRASRPQDPSAE